ncbi:unnamed protein product [Sympodiomycopsis kandeliae]
MTTRIFNICRVKELQEVHKVKDFDSSLSSWDQVSEERIQTSKKHPALQPEAIKTMPPDMHATMQAFYASSSDSCDPPIEVPFLHASSRDERHQIAHTIVSKTAAVYHPH